MTQFLGPYLLAVVVDLILPVRNLGQNRFAPLIRHHNVYLTHMSNRGCRFRRMTCAEAQPVWSIVAAAATESASRFLHVHTVAYTMEHGRYEIACFGYW
jgi:hypothetical protein